MKPELWPLQYSLMVKLYTRRGLVTALRDVSFLPLVQIPRSSFSFFFFPLPLPLGPTYY